MEHNLTNTILIGGIVLMLFGAGEFLYKYGKLKAEYTRKIIHTGTGFITLLCPLLIDNQWYILALCFVFAGLLTGSIKMGFLKSINDIGRESFGSVSYAVAVYICFLVFTWQKDKIFFYLPMLILALADPLAALVGKNWGFGQFTIRSETKSISGSAVFFISALAVCLISIYIHGGYEVVTIVEILGISMAATLAEAFTQKGLDNITVPLVVLAVMLVGKHFEIGIWRVL